MTPAERHMISYMFDPSREEHILTIMVYLDIASCSIRLGGPSAVCLNIKAVLICWSTFCDHVILNMTTDVTTCLRSSSSYVPCMFTWPWSYPHDGHVITIIMICLCQDHTTSIVTMETNMDDNSFSPTGFTIPSFSRDFQPFVLGIKHCSFKSA